MKRFSSLRLRLLLALVLVWTLGAAAMGAYFASQAVTPEEVMEGASLTTQARDLTAALKFSKDGRFQGVSIPARWRGAYQSPDGAFYTLYDFAGRAVARSPNLAAPLASFAPAPGQAITSFRLIGPNQDLAVAARAPGGYGLIVARSNPSRVDETPATQLADLIPALIFIFAAIVGLVAAWGVAGWSLAPLGRAAREARAIGPESPARLTVRGLPAEVRPLAKAVNRALNRVAEAYENEKRFTAEAAHALRTPLAVLDLRLQRAQAEGQVDWPAVRADVAELTRVISGLLALARADRSSAFRDVRPVNLSRLAREAAASLMPSVERAGRAIEVVAPDSLAVQGDRGELFELLVALADNALVHGRGRIWIELAGAGDEAAILRVRDEGPGVAAEAREAVFERFHKLGAASGGAGLGLAVVRQIARAHGGEARFLDGPVVEVRIGPSPSSG